MKKQELFRWVVPSVILLAMYILTRVLAVRSLPPFNDEFIYARWAQEGYFDAAQRLVSLTDGKQPLFIWVTALMMNVLPSPMAAGRIVSIIAGLVTMTGLGVFSFQLFKNRTASLVTGLLYVLFPHALLMDRFALFESLLAALWIWNMVVLYWLVRRPALGTALVLALTLGAMLLVKSSAVFVFILMPIIVWCFADKKAVLRVIGCLILASVLALLYYSVLYLSPSYGMIAEKNGTFLFTREEFFRDSVIVRVLEHIPLYTGWITSYFGWPLVAFTSLAWIIDRKHFRIYLFIISSFLIPFAAVVLAGKTVYPRHLFFMTVPLLVAAGAGTMLVMQKFRSLWFRTALVFVSLFPMVVTSIWILADFKSAPLVSIDRFQYIDGWPAGWGIKDITQYLQQESAQGSFTVLTEGKYGSMPTAAMQLYFSNYPQVRILPIDDETLSIPSHVDWSENVYAILNKNQRIPKYWQSEEVMKIRKGTGREYIRLVKLTESDSLDSGTLR